MKTKQSYENAKRARLLSTSPFENISVIFPRRSIRGPQRPSKVKFCLMNQMSSRWIKCPSNVQPTVEYGFWHGLTPKRFWSLPDRNIEKWCTVALSLRFWLPIKNGLKFFVICYEVYTYKNGLSNMEALWTDKILLPKRPFAGNRSWIGLLRTTRQKRLKHNASAFTAMRHFSVIARKVVS